MKNSTFLCYDFIIRMFGGSALKQDILENKNIAYINYNGLELIKFKNFQRYESIITHGFSTRIGGVSSGECATLNFGFNRKDTKENVKENYKRMGQALQIKPENMVFSNQVHDNKIKIVGKDDCGKGIIIKSDIIGYDGLCTNEPEVALVTFYADCVPVFLLDPVKKVIAACHSGWRGTVKRISAETVALMERQFGCRRENLEAAIGPSIGKYCFEVGEEVYFEFSREFKYTDEYTDKKADNKYYISLQDIIRCTLEDAGVKKDKICLSNICTKCNNDVFFSHRGDNGKTGSLAGFIQLR